MNGLLNIVSTASALPTEQFIQILNGFEAHQTFNQKVCNQIIVNFNVYKRRPSQHIPINFGFHLLITVNKRARCSCYSNYELSKFE